MNITVLVGRLTGDPEARRSQDGQHLVVRYNLAVDRRFKREGEPDADFIPCVAFGKSAEFAEKYFKKGMRVSVQGHIQTGSYTNREGRKVYTTDIIVDQHEFAQSKSEGSSEGNKSAPRPEPAQYGAPDADGFMHIPDGIEEELPFN